MRRSKKASWLRCLVSFLPAAGVSALLCLLYAGPRLGPFYDFLLRRRPCPVFRELLIIDSYAGGQELGDDILEPGAASSLLYTMTELGARTLIIQVPILGLSAGGKATEAEILYRFDEEFSLLSRNIRNLFDAIRTGSVAPAESARYVGELVELSDKGKERLVSALVHRDEEGIDRMERAAAVFGHVRRPGDLRVQLITAGEGGRPGVLAERDEYSRARPDRDGILRRIAPVVTVPGLSESDLQVNETGERTLEHIIYGALKGRYESSEIKYADSQKKKPSQVLVLRSGSGGTDTIIPLDRTGSVLFELPRNGDGFRRIGISDFLAYDEADRDLRRLLLEGETLGIFQGIEGENHPLFLYDYALSLREELASSLTAAPGGGEEKKQLWIESRNKYFASLEDLLYGLTEMNLVGSFEEIIASEFRDNDRDISGETGITRITEMRDSLIQSFAILREKYNEVLELRKKLESALADSFCILGRGSSVAETWNSGARTRTPSLFQNFPQSFVRNFKLAFYRTNPTDMEASALLANSILTGRAVKPGDDFYLFWGSLLWALLTCFFIKSLSPAFTLGTGTLLTLFVGAVFSWSFIFSGLWLDPLVPAAASAAGVVVSFTWALIDKGRYSRRFRQAFGPFVSRACLKSLIRAGRPLPSQTVTVRAAIVAVKVYYSSHGDSSRAMSALTFQEKAADLFKKAGGTIIGTEGDLVSACFGSPLERIFLGGKKKQSPYEDNIHARSAPALRAVDFISEIARRPECAYWHFGLDLGNCTFTWTALSGYFALGTPVQRARTLSYLARRYRTRIVISSSVNEALPELVAKKLANIKEKDGTAGEPFYRLVLRD